MFLRRFYSKEVDFAIRVVSNLMHAGEGQRVNARTLEKEEKVPKHYLFKIVRKLRNHKIIDSFMGANGGYVLKVDPEDLTFRRLIEIINGPLFINACLRYRNDCNRYPINCVTHKRLRIVQQELLEGLEKINFKNLFEDADLNPVPVCIDLDKASEIDFNN